MIIPEVPSGSYFAEGFVIISILSIVLAGICSRASDGSSTDGLPSINKVKFELPLRETFPSISTLTEGAFSKISTAVPDVAVNCSLTLIIFLSILYSIDAFFSLTSIPLKVTAVGSNAICPSIARLFDSVIDTESIVFSSYPRKVISR